MVKQNVSKSYPKQPLIYHSSHSKGWCTASSSVRSHSFMGLGWKLQSEEIPQKLKFLPKDTLSSSENVSQHNGDISSPFFGNSKASSTKETLQVFLKTHPTGMPLASLSSKFYYFSVLFSVKLCSPAALNSLAQLWVQEWAAGKAGRMCCVSSLACECHRTKEESVTETNTHLKNNISRAELYLVVE